MNSYTRNLTAVLLLMVLGRVCGQVCFAEDSGSSPGPTTLAGEVSTEARIDVLELKNMALADVLQLIAQKSGFNIIAGKDVSGKVSLFIKDVTVQEALEVILEANDYAYIAEKGIIRVILAQEFERRYGFKFGKGLEKRIVHLFYADVPHMVKTLAQIKGSEGKIIADEKSRTLVLSDIPANLELMLDVIRKADVPAETRVFELNYARAEDIAGKTKEILTENLGQMRFDERSNKVIVTDTPDKIREFAKVVASFDVRERQVLIEAKVVQVVLSNQFKYGVDWESIISHYHDLDFTSNFDILGSSSKGGRVRVGTISQDDYQVLLEALETEGQTNILSSPSITTINAQEAKILVGSTEPYVTTTTTTPSSGPTTTAESVNFLEVGVKLYVTPTIHNDGFVTMKIRPEVSSVTKTLTTSNNNTIPVVETSEAETTVRVKDGVTIVIGGLIKDETIDTRNKIPVLGDIPLLGYAFRNHDQLVRKTEIIIFLTPRIISGDIAPAVTGRTKAFRYGQN